MTDEPTESPTLGSEASGNIELPDYTIAPEDAERAARIEGFNWLHDTGPATASFDIRVPAEIPLDSLSPGQRTRVAERMAAGASESDAVRGVAQDAAWQLRVQAGPGPNANAYQREFFAIEREMQDAKAEAQRVEFDLLDVERIDVTIDPNTGKETHVRVEKLQGPARIAATNRLRELRYRLELLDGIEGDRRLDKAKWQAVEDEKRLEREAAEDAEAREQARKGNRDDRVAQKAAAYAKAFKDER